MSRLSRSRARLLTLIAEVDANEFYVPAGYPSLHAYCVGSMELSEDDASELIQRARDAVATGQIPRPEVNFLLPGVVYTEPQTDAPAIEPLPDGRFLLRFNLNQDTHDKLRYVQWLLSDESHTADIEEVVKAVLKCARQALMERRGQDAAG